MGKVVNTQEFTRNGKKGIRLTIRQRGTSEGSAKTLAIPQVALKFPAKANNMVVLGVRKINKIAGPFNNYEVDVFVPISNMQPSEMPPKSGSLNTNQMT